MRVKSTAKIMGTVITLIVLLLALLLSWESDLFYTVTSWLLPTTKDGLQHGEMGYRRKPKTIDQLEDQEEAEMLSFLDRELEVQREIASTISIDLDPKAKPEDPEKVKNDPLQIQLIKKNAKKVDE
ncbi:MAG: hypothetical protein IT288_11640 [Bdellovibrionales bacterium]|nr:hypothetical protein [Bdellovibrionales bacterium]